MTIIDEWTGRHARALQAAMRLTNEAFAEHLGIAPRTVSKWRRRPDMVPSPQLQEALDTTLRRADSETRTRFASTLGLPLTDSADLPTTEPVAPGDGPSHPDDPQALDPSMVEQLRVVVGELTRVLAGFTGGPPRSDKVQT